MPYSLFYGEGYFWRENSVAVRPIVRCVPSQRGLLKVHSFGSAFHVPLCRLDIFSCKANFTRVGTKGVTSPPSSAISLTKLEER